MAENSKIEWTDHTFNPWRGCAHRVLPDGTPHPGCEHCYAEAMSKRNPGTLGQWGDEGTRVLASAAQWRLPLKWNADADAAGRIDRVFCASLADVFEDWPGPIGKQPVILAQSGRASDGTSRMTMDDARRRLFELIDATPHLFWLLLTKRPENVGRMWPLPFNGREPGDPLVQRRENVAIGTSISDQATADVLVPQLLALRDLAPVLFLSIEPLVGPVRLNLLPEFHPHPSGDPVLSYYSFNNCTTGFRGHKQGGFIDPKFRVDWVIVGGESGHHARPMHPQWARDLRDQCTAAGVPFFFKQWGEWVQLRQSMEAAAQRDEGKNPGFCRIDANGKPDPNAPTVVYKFGKHAAGRLLDGQLWNELPAAFAAAGAAP